MNKLQLIIDLASNEDDLELLKYMSDQYKYEYVMTVLTGENNISAGNLSSKDQLKISNLTNAVSQIFPHIFFPEFSAEKFGENLAIRLNQLVGKDLFAFPGKYRASDAVSA